MYIKNKGRGVKGGGSECMCRGRERDRERRLKTKMQTMQEIRERYTQEEGRKTARGDRA